MSEMLDGDMHAVSLMHSIEFGNKARDVLDLAISEGGDDKHFWETICKEAARRSLVLLPRTNIRPMSNEEACEFSELTLTFGMHFGKTYEEVYRDDPDYLCYLADGGMKLLRWLAWRKPKL